MTEIQNQMLTDLYNSFNFDKTGLDNMTLYNKLTNQDANDTATSSYTVDEDGYYLVFTASNGTAAKSTFSLETTGEIIVQYFDNTVSMAPSISVIKAKVGDTIDITTYCTYNSNNGHFILKMDFISENY